ncbi:MAG: preprotein translocase subunit SecG [Bacteroidales bacterium]|jgi:preprotein translocase subunit SecG|nr:preprotein translocase subunit SecG [Bacteroidales bacterium]
MYSVISVLIIIVCILLTIIVLVQNSKGGGLAANFSSSNQILGVRKTTDFLEKATWTLATSVVALCLIATMLITSRNVSTRGSVIDSQVENAVDPAAVPTMNTPSLPIQPIQSEQPQPTE